MKFIYSNIFFFSLSFKWHVYFCYLFMNTHLLVIINRIIKFHQHFDVLTDWKMKLTRERVSKREREREMVIVSHFLGEITKCHLNKVQSQCDIMKNSCLVHLYGYRYFFNYSSEKLKFKSIFSVPINIRKQKRYIINTV